MSQNAGLRHAATEPLSLDTKREPRRRGAAGRAAALRRAPSDSDCSAETASLSADSAERVRPLPPPPRANKTRSRRRGSEWEVLEGLKDGQRFERRPEVFNGYLHKKRKWPLKGWHKRFFVVDGGILVYARSPTDVARGRLHGSVDVGLSVISAKARRRRIDIDADEFIYHLRAKTPDVFRTWLNVLKVHRLYRQHLLTFGARESVPKIHAPLEDLPPTDNSSRTTTTFSSSSALSEEECRRTLITAMERNPSLSFVQQIVCYENYQNTKLSPNWSVESEHSPVDECLEEKLVRDPLIVDEELYNHSLCSMNCMAQAYTKVFDGKEMSNSNLKVLKSTPVDTPGDSFNEQAVTTTDLDISSKETSPYIITSEYSNSSSHSNDSCKYKDNKDKSLNKYQVFQQYDAKRTVINKNKPLPQDSVDEAAKIKTDDAERTHQAFSPPHVGKPPPKVAIVDKTNKIASKIKQVPNKIASNLKPAPVSDTLNSGVLHLTSKANFDQKKSKPITRPVKPFKKSPDPTALFLFNKRNLRNSNAESPMKKSRKSTNLVKYKNLTQEPPLPKPYVVSCILKPYKRSVKQIGVDPSLVSKVSQGMQISRATPKHKSIQDHITPSERDRMTEKLFMSIFETSSSLKTSNPDIKSYLNQTVMDLYDINSNRRDHPIKKLFKSLLEYWLNNTGAEKIRNKMRSVRSVNTQVENRTRDQALSQIKCGTESVPTQYCSVDILSLTPDPVETPSNQKQITYSFFKERRIQELERLLKNTVYTYEAVCNKPSKQRDMQITKKLINNIEGVATKTNSYVSDTRASCSFSSEYPEIPETFKHILSDTSIPSDVAKEFLQAYLHILNNTRSYSTERTSRGWCCCNKNGSSNERTKHARDMKCDVQTEAVEKKASVGVATVKTNLKDKTTTRTVKSNKTAADICQATFNNVLDIVTTMFTNKSIDDKPIRLDDTKVEGPCNESGRINCPGPLLTENSDDNTIIIDLTNYNLEHMSMTSDSKLKGTKSISIKLKERPPNDESYQKNLNLKFSNVKRPFLNNKQCSEPNNSFGNYLKNKIPLDPRRSFKNPYIDYSPKADLRHCVNDSTGTSKAYKAMYESNLSLNIQNSDKGNLYTNSKKSLAVRDDWSCFLLSSHCKRSSPYFANKKKDKKKRRSRSKNDETSSSHRDNLDKEGVTSQEKKQVIDEQFIMMLLENLTQLSRSTPEIYKDIFSLYSKLKMKQQKYTRKELQAEFAKIKNACQLKSNEIMDYGGSLNISSDRNLEANHLATGFTSTTPSTLKAMNDPAQRCCENNSPKYYTRDAESSRNHLALYNEDIPKVSDLLIIDACLNSKNDSLLRALKLYLENEDSRNFRFLFPNIEKSRSSRNRNKSKSNLSKVDKEHLRETLQLRKRRILKEKLKRDFHIYQICLTDFLRSQSISSRSTNEDLKTIYKCNSDVTSYPSGLLSPTRPLRGPQASFVSGTPGGRLASWIIESGGPLENASRELGQAQLSVQQLQRLLDAIDSQQHHDTDQVSLEGASPSVKKDRRKFGLRKKKSNSKCASIELAAPLHVDASASYMALSALTAPPSPGGGASPAPASAASLPIACAAARPQSLPGAEALGAGAGGGGPASLCSLTPDHQLREDFTVLAKDLVATLKGVVSTLVCERGRLRAALEAAEAGAAGGALTALRSNLSSALHQNSELRSRLSRIHDQSDLAEISSVHNSDPQNGRQFQQSLSYSSSCVSASEFFDAEEHDPPRHDLLPHDEGGVIELDGDSTSEAGSLSSEEGSASSDNSDGAMLPASELPVLPSNGAAGGWRRRARLPCPRPTPGGPSLWNLLYKNIGKDLSQVSMPVTINEPLNMLQRLCEELEYSSLLDSAAECTSAVERMALMAAFAVSAYAASAHRAASKPFNPLLAETYECIRDDRGFKFLAEQVSHHPPISACHAEAARWRWWQDARIKTKFWGKSMEFQPAGHVHVRLLPHGDHYSWNKVTTCVHNLFGGQRWVDQYGDMHITCHGTDVSAKLNFIKASSWSSSRHEVRGYVTEGSTGVRLRLQGRWSEALYAGEPPAARCLWRPGPMPPEHELYYGFTRFAMELNELEPGMRDVLPHTDTRLRPDQRALEEGDVEAAEQHKHRLEQAQRERRRDLPDHAPAWFRKSMEGGEEMWVFTGEYWEAREAGFGGHRAPAIW